MSTFDVDWFVIVRDYLTSKGNAALIALHAEVGFRITKETLPHKYDGQQSIVLSASPGSDRILNGTDVGIGSLEMVSSCYAAQPEDRGAAEKLGKVFTAALQSVRYDASESGTIMLAVVSGFTSTLVEPTETRRAFARRIWRVNVSAVTSGV